MSWTGPDCFAGLKADLTTDSDVASVVSDVKAYLGTTFGVGMSGEVAVLTLTKPEVLASLDHYKTYLDNQFDDSAHFSKGQSQMLARLRSQVAAMATLGHFLNGDSGLAGAKLDAAIALLQKNWAKKTFFHKDIGVPHAALMASAKPKLDALLSNAPVDLHPHVTPADLIPDAGDGGTIDTGVAEAAPAEAATTTATSTGWTPPFVPGADNDLNPGDHIYTHDDGTPNGQIVVVTPSGLMGELSQDAFDLIPEDEAKALADHGFPGFTDQGVWNGTSAEAAEVAVAEHAYAFYGLEITPLEASNALADLVSQGASAVNVNTVATHAFGPGFNLAAFTHAKDAAGGGTYKAFFKTELEKIASKVGTAPTLSIGGIQFTKAQADSVLSDIAHGKTWQEAFAGVGIADHNDGALTPIYDWIHDEYAAIPGPHGHIAPDDLIAKALGGPDLPAAAPWPLPTLTPEVTHAAASGHALADQVQTGDHGVDIAGVHLTTAEAQATLAELNKGAGWQAAFLDGAGELSDTSKAAIDAWASSQWGTALDHFANTEQVLTKALTDGLAVPSAATVDLFGFQAPAAKAQELLELMKTKAFATPDNPNGMVKSYLDHVFGDDYKQPVPGGHIETAQLQDYVSAHVGPGLQPPGGVFDAYIAKLEELGLTATAPPDPLAHLPVVTHLQGAAGPGIPLAAGDVVHAKTMPSTGQVMQVAVHPDGSMHTAAGLEPMPGVKSDIVNGVNGWQTVAKGPEAVPVEAAAPELPVVDHLPATSGYVHPVLPGDVVYESPAGTQYAVHPGGGQAPDYIASHTQAGVGTGETAGSLIQAGWKPVAKGPDVVPLPAVPTVPVFDGSTLPPSLLAKLAPGDEILTHPGTDTIVLQHLDGSYDTAGPDQAGGAAHWSATEGHFTEDNGWKSVGTIPGAPAAAELPVVHQTPGDFMGANHPVGPGDVVYESSAGAHAVVHPDGTGHIDGVSEPVVHLGDTLTEPGSLWKPVGKGPDLAAIPAVPAPLQIVHDDGSFTNLSDLGTGPVGVGIPQAAKDIIQPGDKVWVGSQTYILHEGDTHLVKVSATGAVTQHSASEGVLHALNNTANWKQYTIAGGVHPAIADLQSAATDQVNALLDAEHAALVVTHLDGATSSLADLAISTDAKEIAQAGDVIYSKASADSPAYVKHPDGTQVFKGSGNVPFQPSTSDAEELLTDPSTPGWSKYTVSGPSEVKVFDGAGLPHGAMAHILDGDHVYAPTDLTAASGKVFYVHADNSIGYYGLGTGAYHADTSLATHAGLIQDVADGSMKDWGVVGAVPTDQAAQQAAAQVAHVTALVNSLPANVVAHANPGDAIYKADAAGQHYLGHPDGTVSVVSASGAYTQSSIATQATINNWLADGSVTHLGTFPGAPVTPFAPAAASQLVTGSDIGHFAWDETKPFDKVYSSASGEHTFLDHVDGTIQSVNTDNGVISEITQAAWAVVKPNTTFLGEVPDKLDIPKPATFHAQPGDQIYGGSAGSTFPFIYFVHPDGTTSAWDPAGGFKVVSSMDKAGLEEEAAASTPLLVDKGIWGAVTTPAAPPNVSSAVAAHAQPGDHVYGANSPHDANQVAYYIHPDGSIDKLYADGTFGSSTASPTAIANNYTDHGIWPAGLSVPAPAALPPVSTEVAALLQPGDHLFTGGPAADTAWVVKSNGSVYIHFQGDSYLSTSPATLQDLTANSSITDHGIWSGGATPAVAAVPAGPVLTVGQGNLTGVSQEIYDLAKPGDKVYQHDNKFSFVHPDGSVSALYTGDTYLTDLATSAWGGEESDFIGTAEATLKGTKPAGLVAPVAGALPASVPQAVATQIAQASVLAQAAALAPSVVAAPADAKLISDLPALLQPKAQAGDTWYYKANTGHHYVVHADGTGHGLGPTATKATSINPGNQIAHSVKQGTIFDGSALPAAVVAPDITPSAAALAKPGDHIYVSPIGSHYFVHPDGTVETTGAGGLVTPSAMFDENYLKTAPGFVDKGVWPGPATPAVDPTADTFWSMPSAIPGQNIQIIAHPDGTAHLITPGGTDPYLISAGGFNPSLPAWSTAHQTATLEAPTPDPFAFLTKAPGDKPDAFNNLGSYAQSKIFTPQQQSWSGEWSYGYNPDTLYLGYGSGDFTKNYLTQVGIDPTDAPLKVQMQAVVAHATDNKSALAALLPQFPSINAAAAKAPTVLVGGKPLGMKQLQELKDLIAGQQTSGNSYYINHYGYVPNNVAGVIAIEKAKEWGVATTGANAAFKTAKSKSAVNKYLDDYLALAKAQEMAVNPNLTAELLYDPQASVAATHLSTPANVASLSNTAGLPSTGVLQGPKIFAAAPMPGGGGYSNSRDISHFSFIFKPHPTDADGSIKKLGALSKGVHPKEIFVDQYGQEWLYKPAPEIMRADAEHYALILQRAFTGVAPTSGVVKAADIAGYKGGPGEVGVVQRMFQKSGDLENVDVSTLPDFQLRDIMSSHVFDWLIANDDSKPDNLMVLSNNRIAGIDKARAFRHFGSDKLALGSLDGNANTIYTTVYAHIISQLKYGTVEQKAAVAKLYAFTIQRAKLTGTMMSDDDYRAVLAKLFEKRTVWNATAYSTKAQVVEAAVFRKNNMADDFTKLWKQIYGQAGVAVPDIDTEPTRLVADELTGRSPDLWDEVANVSGGGKATFFNSTDLEGGAEFWWRSLRDKQDGSGIKPELRGEIKLRKDADAKLHTWLQQHVIGNAPSSSYIYGGNSGYSSSVPDVLPGIHHASQTLNTPVLPGQAKAWKALFEYAKTVNTHANDGDYNAEKIQAGEDLKAAIAELKGVPKGDLAAMNAKISQGSLYFFPASSEALKAGQLTGFEDMLAHYEEQLKIPEVAKATSAKTAEKVADFVWTPPSTNAMGVPDSVYALVKPGDQLYTNPSQPGAVTWFIHADGTVSKVDGVVYSSVPDADIATIVANNTSKGIEPGVAPFDHTKVAAPTPAPVQHVQTVTKFTSLHYELGTFDPDTGLVTYKGEWFDHGTHNTNGLNWGDQAKGTNYRIDFGNGVHAEYTPWQPYDHSADGNDFGLVASQGRFRLTVENWTGDESQLEPYYAMLHDIGMDLTPATEESIQLTYWAQLTGTIKSRKDSSQYAPAFAYITAHIKADTSAADQIAAYRAAYKLMWDPQLVDEADWRPHFQHEDPANPTTLTGRPFWNRPDKSYADLVRAAGSKGLRNIASSVGQQQAAIVKSGGMVSTEEKFRRLGLGPGGETQSPAPDANSGGANNIYTRLGGIASGVYYNPDAMLRMSTFSLQGDQYGNVNNSNIYWDFKPDTFWAGVNPNETLFRNVMTVLDDIEVMLVSPANRTQILAYFAAHGITDLRGLPPEDRFISVPQGNSATTNAALTKAWDVWKARRGILTSTQTTQDWAQSPEGMAEAAARAKYLVDHPGSS